MSCTLVPKITIFSDAGVNAYSSIPQGEINVGKNLPWLPLAVMMEYNSQTS